MEPIVVALELLVTIIKKGIQHKTLKEELRAKEESLRTTRFFLRVFAISTALSIFVIVFVLYKNNEDGNSVFDKIKNEIADIGHETSAAFSSLDQLEYHNGNSNLPIFNHQPPDFVLSSWRNSELHQKMAAPIVQPKDEAVYNPKTDMQLMDWKT